MTAENSYFDEWHDDLFSKDQAIYETLGDVTRGLVRGDVLDLGCGSRVYYNTADVNRWVGLDLSQNLLDKIQFIGEASPTGPIEKILGDCKALDFPDGSFDTVCTIFLLHHLGKTNHKESRLVIEKVLAESYRVLKKGGIMLIAESWPLKLLHVYNLLFPVFYPVAKRLAKVDIPCFFTAGSYEKMATHAGFKRTHILSADLYEDAIWPVLNLKIPGWTQRLSHKYGIYILIK
ncbi:MAG: class I SAM-dependent methyltransferase [Rhodospirillales bacterium]|nr:class I SAM-dependent methyltransferase [Rhodospirillales bacterium]